MWLWCNKCERHKPLYEFGRKKTKYHFSCQYFCRDCMREYKRNYKKSVGGRKMWSNVQLMEFMNVKLEKYIDYEVSDGIENSIQVYVDERDKKLLKEIKDKFGIGTTSPIIRIALRYMFYKLGYEGKNYE